MFLNSRNFLFQATVLVILSSLLESLHIRIHALIWLIGMPMRGSGGFFVLLDLRNAHFIAVVAHAPGLISPVARAMFDLHLSTVVGAIPTAV